MTTHPQSKTFMHSTQQFFLISICLISSIIGTEVDQKRNQIATTSTTDSLWTVVGAGPAGIAVVGILIDVGIPPAQIRWVDSEFNVGRLGKYYTNVPGNGKVEAYLKFLNACDCFQQCKSNALQFIRERDPEERCVLQIVIDALKDVTDYLVSIVTPHQEMVQSIDILNDNWLLTLGNGEQFSTMNVVLATGSHPVSFNYPVAQEIPLDLALDKQTLATMLSGDETMVVVGGSHSAILILKYLYELGVKRIFNLYKRAIVYDYNLGEDNPIGFNGLKGTVAQWAYYVLEKEKPAAIIRLPNTPEVRLSWLPVCTKIIYAVGYERNELPFLTESLAEQVASYDGITGVIAPRLFGIGIAFPEQRTTQDGEIQNLIGIIDFMTYAQRVVPTWIKARALKSSFAQFDQLFRICVL